MYMNVSPYARASASVGRVPPRGVYGTLSAATARNRSGRRSAAFHATGAPQSCPTITAVSTPSASRSPTMSPTWWSCVYWSMASGRSVPP